MSSRELNIAASTSAVGGDPRLAPTAARVMGFSGLLFEAYSSHVNIPELSGSGRREFRQMLQAQNQQFVGLRLDLGSKGLGLGADVDRALSRLDKVMEAAASMLAPLVCVELGPLPRPPTIAKPRTKIKPEEAGIIIIPSINAAAEQQELPPEKPSDPAFISQVDAALYELGRLADRYSVMLAFRSELASYAALDRVVRHAGCSWFGIDLDPALAIRDEWSIEEILSRLGDVVFHVRGCDAVGGADRRAKAAVIGHGDVKWGDLLAHLDAADYQGWYTIDPIGLPNPKAAAEAGRKHMLSFR